MNRNTNSRFSLAPQVDIQRSTFDRSSTVKTSFNVGQCIPFYLEEVLPGDTFKVKTSKVARMQTLKTPMMDDIFLDTYYFFVPNRLVWTHWRNFMGENSDSEWIPENVYTIPQIVAPSGGWNVGTIADYLGVPPGVDNFRINALPFRAYALIMNEWFRDENLSDPLVIEFGDSYVSGSNGSSYVTDVACGGMPFVAAKTHDYFTSALPAPQKGPNISLPLSTGFLPVYTQQFANEHFAAKPLMLTSDFEDKVKASYPLLFENNSVDVTTSGDYNLDDPYALLIGPSFTDSTTGATFNKFAKHDNSAVVGRQPSVSSQVSGRGETQTNYGFTVAESNGIFDSGYSSATPINLIADGSYASNVATINDLRQAFQIQRFYEKCARGGTRYIEIIKSHFGVSSPDARMMRPEYLGGNRLPLNVRQITQTSSTVETSPMGDVAGMSVTADNHFDFDKSFTEHGYIIGICVARYHHTYQQGIDRTFSRKTKFDYYWPVFAHLGEQAIYNKEIYLQGYDTTDPTAEDVDNQVFGYQEAYADYRYKPNRVSGLMRSASASSLDSWHLADDYDSLPYLSDSWIREDKANVDRVLAVTSAVSDQIFADILVTNKTTRPMPLYSIPGLIDHF